MKQILLVIFGMAIVTGLKAQNYSQILVGNSWQITSLTIGTEVFVDKDNTCVYSTEIEFLTDTTMVLDRPCLDVNTLDFHLSNNLLIIENEETGIDTLVITEITTNSFSTLLTTTAIINDSIETEEINIITEYEKL